MSTAITAQSKTTEIVQSLTANKHQLVAALPKHVDVDKFIRTTLTVLNKMPKLAECNRASLFGAIIQSAQLGLTFDGVLGEAYVLPYGANAQLIVGYKGMLKLARQSKKIKAITSRIVYDVDDFEYEFGLNEKLTHAPKVDGVEIKAAYAIATLDDDTKQFDVMTKKQIDAIRARSRSGQNGPWVTDYAEMAKKTVIRRLCKLLPMSPDLSMAVALDERSDAGVDQGLKEVAKEALPEMQWPSALDEITE